MDWRTLAKNLLLVNGRVDEFEAAIVMKAVLADGTITQDEVAFLLEVKREAQSVHSTFKEFVHDVLRRALLRDGRIDRDETTWLRKLVVADGVIGGDELKFLRELERGARSVCPEFVALMGEAEGSDRVMHSRK